MSIFNTEDLSALCDSTSVTNELLVRLAGAGMFLQSSREEIQAMTVNFNKALRLYDLLKTRPPEDKPTIIEILKATGNIKAARVLEGGGVVPPSSVVTPRSVITLAPTSSQGTLNQPAKLKASTFTMSKKLIAEGGAEFQGDNKTVMEILRENPIREDVPAVKFTNFHQWQMEYRNGTSSNREVLQRILNEWVSSYGSAATVEQLTRLCKEEGLVAAADTLETYFNPDDQIVYT